MGWENLIREVGDLLRLIQQKGEQGIEINRSGPLGEPNSEGQPPAMYDFHLRLGTLGPSAKWTGGTANLRRTASQGPVPGSGTVEPVVDLFDEPECVVVIAQLPGVTLSGVHLEIQGQTLVIQAGEGDRRYFRRVPLPFAADLAQGVVSLTNGVLEVRLPKPSGPASEGGGEA